jgi:hypothetical protein
MARKAKSKPKTPQQIAAEKAEKLAAARRQNFEAVGLQSAAADLAANADIEVEREGQKNAERARRADAFDALKDGMAPGAYDAARRLEYDYRIRYGEAERGRAGERVDCTLGPTNDAMIAAADRIEEVNLRLPLRDTLVLRCLIMPQIDATWRAAIERLTGESNPHAQAAVVRGACLNLRDAYASLERRRVA